MDDMTLDLIDESEIKGSGSKYSKEKKSGLDLINKSDLKKDDPKIEVVDKSNVRKIDAKGKKSGLEFIAKENIMVCERTRDGMTDNCVLCKALSNERFDKCPNKYGGF